MGLRDSFKLKLITTLQNSTGFYGEDFRLKTEQLESESLSFSFENKFNSGIYFKFNLINTTQKLSKSEESMYLQMESYKGKVSSYRFDVTMSPGEMFDFDTILCKNEEEVNNSFKNWSVRAWEEFSASSIIRKLEREEQKFQELSDQMGSIGDEYFSIEEAERLKFRLEELEKTFREHINLNEDNKDTLETNKNDLELKSLNNDISFLTDNITTLNKRNWFNVFFSRFSPLKLDAAKRNILFKFGGKGLGLLIESKTGDSTVKDFIEEITR